MGILSEVVQNFRSIIFEEYELYNDPRAEIVCWAHQLKFDIYKVLDMPVPLPAYQASIDWKVQLAPVTKRSKQLSERACFSH